MATRSEMSTKSHSVHLGQRCGQNELGVSQSAWNQTWYQTTGPVLRPPRTHGTHFIGRQMEGNLLQFHLASPRAGA